MSQREQLQTEIAELERKKAGYTEQLSQTDKRTAKHDEIKAEIDDVDAELATKRKELEQLAVEAAQTDVFSQFDRLTFGEGEEQVVLSLRDLCKDESRYQLASQFIQTAFGNQAQTHEAIVASLESKIYALEELVREIGTLREDNIRLSDKAADLETKRDAAAMEISELKEEVDRLTEDNEALRNQLKQMATRPGTTASGIDQLALAKKIRAEEEAAKPGIYNKRWKDTNSKNTYLATLSATGEEIEIPWLEVGKYREESAEDAERFRQAEEERRAKEALELAVEAPPLTFQDETEDAGVPTGDSSSPNGTVEDAPVTRAEFEELKKAVDVLYIRQNAIETKVVA